MCIVNRMVHVLAQNEVLGYLEEGTCEDCSPALPVPALWASSPKLLHGTTIHTGSKSFTSIISWEATVPEAKPEMEIRV